MSAPEAGIPIPPPQERQAPRRIAVVAVHGIGKRVPGRSAREIADLLTSLECSDDSANPSPKQRKPLYSSFAEEPIAVAVQPVKLLTQPPQGLEVGIAGPFEALAKNFAKRRSVGGSPQRLTYEQDHSFMRAQLQSYKLQETERTYRSTRFQGVRQASPSQREAKVDVYELYWKDLSSLGSGVATFLGELYQLLFHLTSLGCQAVRGTWIENPDASGWRRFATLQKWTSLCLTVPIAFINLVMLGVAFDLIFCSIFSRLPDAAQRLLNYSLVWTALLGVVGLTLIRKRQPLGFLLWIAPVLVFIAALLRGVLVAIGSWQTPGISSLAAITLSQGQVFSLFMFVTTAGLIAKIVRLYDRQRPGVARMALYVGALLGLPIVLRILIPPNYAPGECSNCPVLAAHVSIIETLRSLLDFTWLVFFGLLFASHAAGSIAVPEIRLAEGRRKRALESRWTARVTIGLSSLVFSLITVVIWIAFASVLSPSLPKVFNYHGVSKYHLADIVLGPNDRGLYTVLFGVIVLALILEAWALAPSAWAELFPRRPSEGQKANDESERMGNWMTNGHLLIPWSGWLLYSTMFLVYPIGLLLLIVSTPVQGSIAKLMTFVGASASYIPTKGADGEVTTVTMIMVGTAMSFLALHGRLTRIALGFRPALSLVLDVDNYFREHPLDANPRARIAARFVSLLRYLCRSREPLTGREYDAIVIVAHSQGSVIASDLLRFIHTECSAAKDKKYHSYDRELSRLDGELPIYLFTMGTPLRQVYARLFPDLYKWARTDNDRQRPPPQGTSIPCDASPDPNPLGVKGWANAYRSGDYIGRQLWVNEKSPLIWHVPVQSGRNCKVGLSPVELSGAVFEDRGKTRREFCIGYGAHNHYWDATADLIALELDRIISSL